MSRSGADAPSQDFALQFARAYLTYEAGNPQELNPALRAVHAGGMDRDGGVFVSSGSQRVLWEEVASDQPAVVNGRVVTIAAGGVHESEPLYLAVTVRHPSGGPVSLAGYPSFVGAPYVSREADGASYDEATEPAVTQVVTRVLQNYLIGSVVNLKADLTNDAVVTLPTVRLKVQSVDSIGWVGGSLSRSVVATVTAGDSSVELHAHLRIGPRLPRAAVRGLRRGIPLEANGKHWKEGEVKAKLFVLVLVTLVALVGSGFAGGIGNGVGSLAGAWHGSGGAGGQIECVGWR